MIAIVMCDRNFAIASNGKQPIHLKEDLKRFRKRTNHATVVYGRKTLEELPGGLLLPERRNLILSRNRNLVVSDSNHSKVVHNVADVIRLMQDDVRRFIAFGENAKLYRPFYVIGGSEIYYQFITYCDEVIMTMVDTEFEYPTAYFPDLSMKDPVTKRPEWIKKYKDVSVEDVDVDTGEVYQTKILHWSQIVDLYKWGKLHGLCGKRSLFDGSDELDQFETGMCGREPGRRYFHWRVCRSLH